MLSEKVLSVSEPICPQRTYILTRRISAIRLIRAVDGHRGKLGEILQLEPDTQLDCCGEGYNERTAKVHCCGEFYFVFWQDLDDAESDRCPGIGTCQRSEIVGNYALVKYDWRITCSK
jgi:hypothetical protein